MPGEMAGFTRYRPWVPATLALWWLALGLGVATYAGWYGPALTGLPAGERP